MSNSNTRRILVTGAARRIGRQMALDLDSVALMR